MFITCPKCSARYKIPSEIKLTAGKRMQCSACQHVFKFQPEPVQEEVLQPPEDAVLSFSEKTEKIVIKETKIPARTDSSSPASLPEVFCPVYPAPKKSTYSYLFMLGCVLILLALSILGWLYRDLLQMNVSTPVSSHVVSNRIRPLPSVPHKKVPQKLEVENTIPFIFEEESENLNEMDLFKVSEENEVQNFSIQSVHFRLTEDKKTVLIEGVLKNISERKLKLPEKVYALGYGADGAIVFEKEIYLPGAFLNSQMEQAFFGTYGPVKEEVQWVDVVLKR